MRYHRLPLPSSTGLLTRIEETIVDMNACMSFVNEVICIKCNVKSLAELPFIEARYEAEIEYEREFLPCATHHFIKIRSVKLALFYVRTNKIAGLIAAVALLRAEKGWKNRARG